MDGEPYKTNFIWIWETVMPGIRKFKRLFKLTQVRVWGASFSACWFNFTLGLVSRDMLWKQSSPAATVLLLYSSFKLTNVQSKQTGVFVFFSETLQLFCKIPTVFLVSSRLFPILINTQHTTRMSRTLFRKARTPRRSDPEMPAAVSNTKPFCWVPERTWLPFCI